MLLKASFKHKVPKHILTKQLNKAFFEITARAKVRELKDWSTFTRVVEVDEGLGSLFFIPGTSSNFISITSPINLNQVMFLNV